LRVFIRECRKRWFGSLDSANIVSVVIDLIRTLAYAVPNLQYRIFRNLSVESFYHAGKTSYRAKERRAHLPVLNLPACRRFPSWTAVEEVIMPEAIGITCSEIELKTAAIVTVAIGDVENA
jgi:hypothetical protein